MFHINTQILDHSFFLETLHGSYSYIDAVNVTNLKVKLLVGQ